LTARIEEDCEVAEPVPGIDLLCVSPHTDDAEIGLGGTLRLLSERGRRVWACDLTRGELASNATPGERWVEAAAASEVLGLAGRLQLDLPDGFVDAGDPRQVGAVVAVLRRLRPRWVVCAPDPVRHPDHVATPPLVARAAFLARLTTYRPPAPAARAWPGSGPGWSDETPAWTCEAVLECCPQDGRPSLFFDCSASWGAKLEAIACYRSQFDRGEGRRATHINDPGFLERIERRGRSWGFRIGARHAEALRTISAPVLRDLPGERWS
jgi:bacillithiol biosynthesis deacetylase BshB1